MLIDQKLAEPVLPDGELVETHRERYAATLHEARCGTPASTPMAVELAQRMANAALVAMRDSKRAIADKLSSQEGANAVSTAKSAKVHEKTKGAHVMNAQCGEPLWQGR